MTALVVLGGLLAGAGTANADWAVQITVQAVFDAFHNGTTTRRTSRAQQPDFPWRLPRRQLIDLGSNRVVGLVDQEVLVLRAHGRTAVFTDGPSAEVDAVVWATGFRQDHTWVDIPGALAGDGCAATTTSPVHAPDQRFLASRIRALEKPKNSGDELSRSRSAVRPLVSQPTTHRKDPPMSTAPAATSVQADIVVDVPQENAFRVFTERFDEVKPREHNLLTAPIERSVLEPRAGGTVYDVGSDGSRCAWARVLAYEPSERLVLSWDISPRWQLEPDSGHTSEVEIRFTPEGAGRTRVALEHRHLDRHGEGWESFTSLGSGSGWPLYLDRFRAATQRDAAGA